MNTYTAEQAAQAALIIGVVLGFGIYGLVRFIESMAKDIFETIILKAKIRSHERIVEASISKRLNRAGVTGSGNKEEHDESSPEKKE